MAREDQFERFLANVQGLDERRARELAALSEQSPSVAAHEFWNVGAGADIRYVPFEQCAHKEAAYWDPVFNAIILGAPEGEAAFAEFKAYARKAYEHYWGVRDNLWRAIARVERPAMQAVYRFIADVTWLPSGFEDGDPISTYVEDVAPLETGLRALNTYAQPHVTDEVLLGQLERLGVDELKQICREHGLKVGGRKMELVERVRENVRVEVLRRAVAALSPVHVVSVRQASFVVLCVDWLVKKHLSQCLGQDLYRYDSGWDEYYRYYVISKGDGTPCPQCAALHGRPMAYGTGAPRPPLHPGCDCRENGYGDPA